MSENCLTITCHKFSSVSVTKRLPLNTTTHVSVQFSTNSVFSFPQRIVIKKAGGPLGLSIVGGVDHTSHPFGLDSPGVFISKVGRAGETCH